MRFSTFFATASLLVAPALAQLSGSVGPTTSTAAKKAKKVCTVSSSGDFGAALTSAWNSCKSGGLIQVPAGTYSQTTGATLSGGTGVAIQIDGTVSRPTSAGSFQQIVIENSQDIELFSSTGNGVLDCNGYAEHSGGAAGSSRNVRFVSVTNFSIHDLKLVDAGAFHLVMATVTNGEVYNMLIRGAIQGGQDGVDVWGTNVWIHDIKVQNRDECVTVKSPAKNILVEQVYCNTSGGCAMGSLSDGCAISQIEYRNIYTYNSNQMYMIKSNGGSGYVTDVTLSNFIGYDNAYLLDINQYWNKQSTGSSGGVALSNITFDKFQGSSTSASRPVINLICDDSSPCTNIHVTNAALCTSGTPTWACRSAYGSGACLKSGSGGSYSQVTQSESNPSTCNSFTKMSGDQNPSWGTSSVVPIPSWPSQFFPGLSPIKALAAN